jgi:hypothetical protein
MTLFLIVCLYERYCTHVFPNPANTVVLKLHKIRKLHTLNQPKMVLTADVRERNAEDSLDSANSSDSLVRLCVGNVVSVGNGFWRLAIGF